MDSGFRRNDNDEWQHKCPGCGKFVAPENGWCAWASPEDDLVSLYCGEVCHTAHRARTGLTDADFPQYADA